MRLATAGPHRTSVLLGIGPRIVLVWAWILVGMCPPCPYLHYKASQTLTYTILGNGLPCERNGFTVISVDSGINIKSMNASCQLSAFRISDIKIPVNRQFDVSLYSLNFQLAFGGTQVHLSWLLHLSQSKVQCQKTKSSEEVTAASPLKIWYQIFVTAPSTEAREVQPCYNNRHDIFLTRAGVG